MMCNAFVTVGRVKSIKKARRRAGLSLADVAGRSGLFHEAVARAERDGIDPRASTVARIADALGIPVCELFENSGHGRKAKKKA